MKPIRSILEKITPATKSITAWRVAPIAPARQPAARAVRRQEPTTFHRCLAVHLHFAAPRGGLS